MKKGFTLIELLVVIAIIAILAAILFPVFAQAKTAAKGTASLSNLKQIAIANLLYNADHNDFFSPASGANSNGPLQIAGQRFSTWVWNVFPYVKTVELMSDPMAPNLSAGPTPAWTPPMVAMLEATYGYNYYAMSPAQLTGGTFARSATSQTALRTVSETPMVVTRYSRSESTIANGSLWWWGSINGPTTMATIDPPFCQTFWCMVPDAGTGPAWGVGNWYDTDILNGNLAAGARTGGNSLRRSDRMIIAFGDGHAASAAPGRMARGTNWGPQVNYTAVEITNPEQYVWGRD